LLVRTIGDYSLACCSLLFGILSSGIRVMPKISRVWVIFCGALLPQNGDATATYIRMVMVPSRMYAKHQYNTIQGSECGNTWCYIFQYKIVQVLSHHRLWHNIT